MPNCPSRPFSDAETRALRRMVTYIDEALVVIGSVPGSDQSRRRRHRHRHVGLGAMIATRVVERLDRSDRNLVR